MKMASGERINTTRHIQGYQEYSLSSVVFPLIIKLFWRQQYYNQSVWHLYNIYITNVYIYTQVLHFANPISSALSSNNWTLLQFIPSGLITFSLAQSSIPPRKPRIPIQLLLLCCHTSPSAAYSSQGSMILTASVGKADFKVFRLRKISCILWFIV